MNALPGHPEVVALDADSAGFLAEMRFAHSLGARMRGLLGRASLPPGEGLYLAPCRAVHTWGMRFTLDLVFVNRDWCVCSVRQNVTPWRCVWGGWAAHGVIEIAAGWLTPGRVRPGMVLRRSSALS